MIPTVSLVTARLLKENGFPQNTEFGYGFKIDNIIRIYHKHYESAIGVEYLCSSPTTDKLLDELPYVISNREYCLMICKGDNCYGVWYGNISERDTVQRGYFRGESLCECLASLWLWLKKEGLL